MDSDPLAAMEALGTALAQAGQQAAADQGLAYGDIVTDPFGTGGPAPDASSGTQNPTQPDTSSKNMKAWIAAVQNLQPDINPGICQSMAGGMPAPTYIYQCGQSGSQSGSNGHGPPPVLDWTTFGKPTNPQGVPQTDFANLVVTQEAPLLAGFNPPSTYIPGLGVTVSPNGTLAVPPSLLPIFQAAAATCPGLPWTLLAADAYQESRWDPTAVRIAPPALPSYGIGQFEQPTFNEYDKPVPADMAPNPPQGAEPPSVFDPWDSEFAAARLLCTDGVATNPQAALGGYNAGTPNTWDTPYIDSVLQWQSDIEAWLATQGAPAKATSPQLAQLITFAMKAIGTPYVWGGTGVATSGGFDCSGLTQAAAASAGITLPRTSEAQWEALPHTNTPTPGDLVFYDFPTDSQPPPNHVGIYIGNNEMIDAPQTGQNVRIDPIWTANLMGYAIP
jgi:cell wall-associated NlpC family hydrolase